jgi:hypothetical protein
VDAPNAKGYAVYIDFLELIEEKIRKSRNHLDVDDIVYHLAFIFLVSHDIEILVTLSDREGRSPWEELVSQDLGQENVLGHILGFKELAADCAVSRAQVARLPAEGTLAEGDFDLVV